MGLRYLYLRTPILLARATDCLSQLSEALENYDFDVFTGGTQYIHWSHGFIIRFEASQTPKQLARWLGPKLDKFEGWACHDGVNRVAEYPSGAQTSNFFDGLGSKSVHQLLMKYDKDDQRLVSTIARMRADLEFKGAAKCKPVADFSDGQILLIGTNQPAKITFARCQNVLRDRIRFAFVDAAGGCLTTDGPVEDQKVWVPFGAHRTQLAG